MQRAASGKFDVETTVLTAIRSSAILFAASDRLRTEIVSFSSRLRLGFAEPNVWLL